MVTERTIMIFPKFKNMHLINKIRNEYDPLAEKLLPHLTLVFPFTSEFSKEEIEEWLAVALNNIEAFPLKMGGFSKQVDRFGNYLFLNVMEGNEKIIELHSNLYKGILESYKTDVMYKPHMTVGRVQTKEDMDNVFQMLEHYEYKFETIVDTISVEVIGEDEESNIELEFKLR
jgi:2'-5' RNA ligase